MECEFKLELEDEAAARRVRAAFPAAPAEHVRQTNHFLDSRAGGLRAAGLALRVRAEEERWFLTLKGPRIAAESGVTARAEEELELDAMRARAILSGAQDALDELPPTALVARARSALAGRELVCLGSFVNERTRLGPIGLGALPPLVVLELDRTTFPDGVAHELEAELPEGISASALETELRGLFEHLALPWRPAGNKAARFFRALDSTTDTKL